jgi:predicted metalloprotease with PDZ domain
MKLKVSPIPFCQVLSCIAGIAACAFPLTIWDRGFWGTGMSSSSLDPGVAIDRIEPGSPAAVAGLQNDDRILAINGREVGYYELDDAWG